MVAYIVPCENNNISFIQIIIKKGSNFYIKVDLITKWIKLVIRAIPTYVIGVYRFPVAIIRSIHSVMARFWWGNKGDQRSMHWKSWATLCNPKCLGGMDFRDLVVFNEALLGFQAWRLIQSENSLLSGALKAKYYLKCNFLES